MISTVNATASSYRRRQSQANSWGFNLIEEDEDNAIPASGTFGGPPLSGGPLPRRFSTVSRRFSFDVNKIIDDTTQPWSPNQGGPAHQWNDLPQQPLPEDHTQGPPQDHGLPPPPQQQFQGYEKAGGFGEMSCMPPPPPPASEYKEPPKIDIDNISSLNEDQCREAMLEFVAAHCCYGKGCAKNMKIETIIPSSALHYILETYCESRMTGNVNEPFRGQPIDGPQNGVPPAPWQIHCEPNFMFHDHIIKLEVPHTATVQMCYGCDGRGFNRCWRCMGLGWNRCGSCGGDGRVLRHDHEGRSYHSSCNMCGGDGRRRCYTCGGDGRITCEKCNGYRRLKCYIQLSVKFQNHKSDHILEKTDMPDELVREVKGTPIFTQQLPQVWPITEYHVQEINENSVRLVEQHKNSFPNERQKMQRQTLRAVPVTEVAYLWKDTKTRFWVYGRERSVYAPDYPQQCCWGCTIL